MINHKPWNAAGFRGCNWPPNGWVCRWKSLGYNHISNWGGECRVLCKGEIFWIYNGPGPTSHYWTENSKICQFQMETSKSVKHWFHFSLMGVIDWIRSKTFPASYFWDAGNFFISSSKGSKDYHQKLKRRIPLNLSDSNATGVIRTAIYNSLYLKDKISKRLQELLTSTRRIPFLGATHWNFSPRKNVGPMTKETLKTLLTIFPNKITYPPSCAFVLMEEIRLTSWGW